MKVTITVDGKEQTVEGKGNSVAECVQDAYRQLYPEAAATYEYIQLNINTETDVKKLSKELKREFDRYDRMRGI